VIITDSLSTLTAIKGNNHTKNQKTIKLREMMNRLKKQITPIWVPGHMDIPGNEQADEEAKAALDDDLQLEQNEEYPPNDLENWLKTEMTKNKKERRTSHGPRMNGIPNPQCPFATLGLQSTMSYGTAKKQKKPKER
jgi:hypothetical protein